MVQASNKLSLSGSARNRGVEGCIQDHLGLLTGIVLTNVAQELKEPDVTRQVELAHTTEHPQIGLPTICQPQSVTFLPPLYDRLTMHPARIVADTLTEHGHQDAQQTVPNSAQSLAMPMAFGPQSRIHLAEVRITLHGNARHVIQRMPQAWMTPAPHHDLTAFATLSRHRA